MSSLSLVTASGCAWCGLAASRALGAKRRDAAYRSELGRQHERSGPGRTAWCGSWSELEVQRGSWSPQGHASENKDAGRSPETQPRAFLQAVDRRFESCRTQELIPLLVRPSRPPRQESRSSLRLSRSAMVWDCATRPAERTTSCSSRANRATSVPSSCSRRRCSSASL